MPTHDKMSQNVVGDLCVVVGLHYKHATGVLLFTLSMDIPITCFNFGCVAFCILGYFIVAAIFFGGGKCV